MPQVQSKALVDGESREPSERFSGRLFLFFAVRHGSFLSPNRERKEWGRKIPSAILLLLFSSLDGGLDGGLVEIFLLLLLPLAELLLPAGV